MTDAAGSADGPEGNSGACNSVPGVKSASGAGWSDATGVIDGVAVGDGDVAAAKLGTEESRSDADAAALDAAGGTDEVATGAAGAADRVATSLRVGATEVAATCLVAPQAVTARANHATAADFATFMAIESAPTMIG